MRPIKRIVIYILTLLNRMKKHQIGAFSAQMAYFFTLSIFPLLIFLFSILSKLNLNYDYVYDLLQGILPANMQVLIVEFMEQTFTQQSGALLSVSGILMLYSSSKGVNALQNAINYAHGYGQKRNFIVMKLYSMFYTLMFILLIVVSLIIPSIGMKLVNGIERLMPFTIDFSWVSSLFFVRSVLLPVMYVVVIGSTYVFLPNEKLKIKDAYKGAGFAIVASYSANLIFSNIVVKVTDYSILYGSLSAMIAFMVWLYAQCTILMIGAEINAHEKEKKDE